MLVSVLEENGIGRPSTYAPIINTITQRKYVYKENGKLLPTPLGQEVTSKLVAHFPTIVDAQFTAVM